MYHKLAQKAAATCLTRNWISSEQFEWCVYAIEKRINHASVFVAFLIVAIVSKSIREISIFAISVLALRSRIGGWHAKHAWSCQLISFITMLFSVFVCGPILVEASLIVVALFDAVIIFAGLTAKPVYPAQLHFTAAEIIANNAKKNRTLFVIIAIHLLSLILGSICVVIYSALGMSVSLIALFIQKHNQESGGVQNEEN